MQAIFWLEWAKEPVAKKADKLTVIMSAHQKFAHDDVVKIMPSGKTGLVKGVRQDGTTIIYQVQLPDAAEPIDAPEDELELVKIANDDETGYAIRYIS